MAEGILMTKCSALTLDFRFQTYGEDRREVDWSLIDWLIGWLVGWINQSITKRSVPKLTYGAAFRQKQMEEEIASTAGGLSEFSSPAFLKTRFARKNQRNGKEKHYTWKVKHFLFLIREKWNIPAEFPAFWSIFRSVSHWRRVDSRNK